MLDCISLQRAACRCGLLDAAGRASRDMATSNPRAANPGSAVSHPNLYNSAVGPQQGAAQVAPWRRRGGSTLNPAARRNAAQWRQAVAGRRAGWAGRRRLAGEPLRPAPLAAGLPRHRCVQTLRVKYIRWSIGPEEEGHPLPPPPPPPPLPPAASRQPTHIPSTTPASVQVPPGRRTTTPSWECHALPATVRSRSPTTS